MWLSEQDYDFIYSRSPRLCVDLVIQDNSKLLLCYRDIEPEKDLWHLPGGRVHYGELLQDACSRIAMAEIGVNVIIDKMIGFIQIPDEIQNGKPRHSVSIVFKCIPVVLIHESPVIKFFSMCPLNMNVPHATFLKKIQL